MTFDEIRTFCLSLENVIEKPHFDRTAFRSKRIFLTHIPETYHINVKLTPKDQDLFSLPNKSVIYPVTNKWGLQGWTTIEFNQLDDETLIQIIETAYQIAST
ncbi:MmcQ/YjbR family DNA-binding protein [Jiulongibacter sediminis]|nr:MmcQ/YjbR family DNA-binding protein [Jiulongibacter sediminis]